MNGTDHAAEVEHALAAMAVLSRCEGLAGSVRRARERFRACHHDGRRAAAAVLACRLAVALDDWTEGLGPAHY